MQYGKEYLDLIYQGLNHAIVTTKDKKNLKMDEGLALWSEQVDKIRDYGQGLIFFCGNGASASMAEHMSHDWFQNARINTLTCAETAHITAISNDISYDDVYAFRIERVLGKNDIFIGISSSGNSGNIVKALETARDKGAFCITISGKQEDNKIRQIGDLNFYVPLQAYGEVESAHAVLLHMALDYYLDKYLGGRH